jgi:hypothetical protein
MVDVLIQDPLLATANELPPVGANGLAFKDDETLLFIANTGDDRILTLDMISHELEVFAESVDGPDGIAFDDSGILWVAANQADQLVGFDPDGRRIATLGSFLGIRSNGSVRGLLFPASPAIHGEHIFVTNLALPFPGVPGQFEGEVTTYSLSRIKVPNTR